MNEVFQTFERAYLAKKRYSEILGDDVHDIKKIMKMFATGCCYPLSGRDEEGRKFVLVQTKKWDAEVYTFNDFIRLLLYIHVVLLEEEETQIAGIGIIVDSAEITMKHIMTASDIKKFADFEKKCGSARQKGTYVLNLPSFAFHVVEIFNSIASEKLKKRFVNLKHNSQLKEHIDVKLLPIQYGGTRTEDEMMQDFLKLKEAHQENISKILNFKIDWERVPIDKIRSDDGDEAVGTFRKLEID